MISHSHKFIFIHINCCGGTSIEKTLAQFGGIMQPQVDPSISPLEKATQHLTASEMNVAFGEEIWREYFTFAIVRNPWDRMVTYYLTHPKINRVMSFKEFILHDGGFYDHDRMYSPCSDWLANKNGEPIPLNFIGKFENLVQDFKSICYQLRIETSLVHANKTKNKQAYQTYYDDESIDALANKFKNDIEQFSYEF